MTNIVDKRTSGAVRFSTLEVGKYFENDLKHICRKIDEAEDIDSANAYNFTDNSTEEYGQDDFVTPINRATLTLE